jgi:hypothetical protein
MARGWESKSVESQQDDAARRGATKPALSPAERDLAARRRTLELSRARITAEIEQARAAGHRAMLTRALADLDSQLKTLA